VHSTEELVEAEIGRRREVMVTVRVWVGSCAVSLVAHLDIWEVEVR
jgi:hypothetical protein